MYLSTYGFSRPPFERADLELFRCPTLDELHARLTYLVEHRAVGVLTGDPGSGKSTALRRLKDSLHPDQVRALYIHDTVSSPADFLRYLALELGLEPGWSRALCFRSIQEEIHRLATERHLTVLLVIDEAQALRPDVLAQLPLLTNFDWDGHDRLALLLCGQVGLRQKLRLAHLEALTQRVTVRFALKGFDRDTTRLYLEHRLRAAGLDRPLFAEPAIEALFNTSQGVMRRIDTLAHHALCAAAAQRARLVDADHVVKAAEEAR
jgi:type II secretory pathway predicted ATPase ExeA